MTRKLILTDVDNTIFDFGDTFQQWLADRNLHGSGRLNDIYHITEFLDCNSHEMDELLVEFYRSDTFENLPPVRGSVEALQSLHERGYDFVAITACHDLEGLEEARRDNLERVFGFAWPVVHITGLAGHKTPYLEAYEPTIWVEDSLKQALQGVEAGHRTFLLDYPYNQSDHRSFERVTDWQYIKEWIEACDDNNIPHC